MSRIHKKSISLVISIATILLTLSGCSLFLVKGNLELAYGESLRITDKKLDNRTDLVWSSSNSDVASVSSDGVVEAVGPGESIIVATADNKKIAEYNVEVTTVPITNIILSTNTCEVVEGQDYVLNYTLYPNNASNYGLEWKSADEKVATVDGTGTIKGISPGQTTVSVSTFEGIVMTCSVTVKKEVPNFKQMYGQYEGKKWFSVGDDGTWMSIDTNPNDDDSDEIWKYMTEWQEANDNLPKILSDLGYSSSVYEKMMNTTWSMGKQEESSDTTIASWTYHPDKGLEVLFEVKK